jgi:hypothetical protein
MGSEQWHDAGVEISGDGTAVRTDSLLEKRNSNCRFLFKLFLLIGSRRAASAIVLTSRRSPHDWAVRITPEADSQTIIDGERKTVTT